MNKWIKALVAFLGGIELAFAIATPVLLSLLITIIINLSNTNRWILLIVGSLSSIYRGLRVWIN